MKKAIVLVTAILFLLTPFVFAVEEEGEPVAQCPKTLMTDQDRCMRCHTVPSWFIKETEPDEALVYPAADMKILDYGMESAKGYLEVGVISMGMADNVRDFFRYLRKHGITYAILDLHSPGGSLFSGWKIKGLVDEWKAEGNICETRVRGFAASAAAIIFAAGSKGYRTVNARAEVMFHELWTAKWLDVSTPSDKEDEAKVLRHLQDTITSWLALRSHMTKKELDDRMRKKEFWVNGMEAKEFGFADVVIGD